MYIEFDDPEDVPTRCSMCDTYKYEKHMEVSDHDSEILFCDAGCKARFEKQLDRCGYCMKVVTTDGMHIHGSDFCDDCCYKKWHARNIMPEKIFAFGRRD